MTPTTDASERERLLEAVRKFVELYFNPAVNMLGEPLQSHYGKERRAVQELRELVAACLRVESPDEKLRSLEQQLAARSAEVEALRTALREAIEVIHTWHGDVAWDIYANHSPEMKRLNAALQEKSRDAG